MTGVFWPFCPEVQQRVNGRVFPTALVLEKCSHPCGHKRCLKPPKPEHPWAKQAQNCQKLTKQTKPVSVLHFVFQIWFFRAKIRVFVNFSVFLKNRVFGFSRKWSLLSGPMATPSRKWLFWLRINIKNTKNTYSRGPLRERGIKTRKSRHFRCFFVF